MPQAGNIFRLSESRFQKFSLAADAQRSPVTLSVGLQAQMALGLCGEEEYRTL